MEDCIKCGMSLSGGDLTLPWEDDDNPNAYVICPHCGYKNTVYVDDSIMVYPIAMECHDEAHSKEFQAYFRKKEGE